MAERRVHPEIYYTCCNCHDHGEGTCYPHDMVRLIPNGEWICEECFDAAPAWEYIERPADQEDPDPPRWIDLPPVPKYVPEAVR